MKIFVLLSISLAVAVGMPPVNPDIQQHPILTEDQHPLVGDWLPVQGHVVVEEPAAQPRLKEAEERGKQENIHVEEKPQVKDEPQLQTQSDFKVELDVNEKPEDKKPEQGPETIPGDKVDPEPPSPDFKVESEVKVEPESQEKTEFEAKSETGLEVEEKHIDMEGTYEVMDLPIMHLETMKDEDDDVKNEEEKQTDTERTDETMHQPVMYLEPINDKDDEAKSEEEKNTDTKRTYETVDQSIMYLEPINDEDDDVKSEEEKNTDTKRTYESMDQPIMHLEPMNDEDAAQVNSEDEMSEEELLHAEKTIVTAFRSPDPAPDEQLLPEEEEALGEKNNEVAMKLKPEVSSDQEQLMSGGYMMDEGPGLDALGEPMLHLEEYFPNEEDFIGLEPEIQQNPLTVDMMMRENPDQEFVGEESVMDTMPMMDETEIYYQSKQATGRGYYPGCAGVVLQGKCYVFYRGPKRAEEAEFFCQRSTTGGHLASITTEHIHKEVMWLILKTNGAYTRTWIGGLRYLGTNRFVWLDGEHWGYADWLSGEPNNTADKEDCVEVLAQGKFNDFTCWEPQAFVCSYPYQ